MKLRIALLDDETEYRQKFVDYVQTHLNERMDVYTYSDEEGLLPQIKAAGIDVVLGTETLVPEPSKLPKGVVVAYWTDAPHITSVMNNRAICRYQKIELIYQQILDYYSEMDGHVATFTLNSAHETGVYTFLGAQGGVGASSAAAGCAIYFARNGKRTLFLDLTEFGIAALYFSGSGSSGLSDVIYAVKSHNANLALKIESYVKKDESGVYYFDSCRVALDARDTNAENVADLLKALTDARSFEAVVVDADLRLTPKLNAILKASKAVVFVSDGSITAENRLQKVIESCRLDDGGAQAVKKAILLYNKMQQGGVRSNAGLSIIGEIPYFNGASPSAIASEIGRRDVFRMFMYETGSV